MNVLHVDFIFRYYYGDAADTPTKTLFFLLSMCYTLSESLTSGYLTKDNFTVWNGYSSFSDEKLRWLFYFL